MREITPEWHDGVVAEYKRQLADLQQRLAAAEAREHAATKVGEYWGNRVNELNKQLAEAEEEIRSMPDEICKHNKTLRQLIAAEALLVELTIHDFRKHGCWTAGMHGRVRDVIGQAKYEQAKEVGGEH